MADRLRIAMSHEDPSADVMRIPLVYHELSTDRLLVMEQATGQGIDVPGAIAASGTPPTCWRRHCWRVFFSRCSEAVSSTPTLIRET